MMIKKFHPVVWGLSVVLLLLSAQNISAANRLSASQIKAFFKGTFVGQYGRKKTPFTIHASVSGRLKGNAEGKYDNGRWRLKGNRLCITWKHWDADRENCRHVVRLGGWYATLKSNGKIKLRLRRK